MKNFIDENEFLRKASETLKGILNSFKELSTLNHNDFNKNDTAIIAVDIVKGFCEFGNLSSSRVFKIIPNVVSLIGLFDEYEKVYFVDQHEKDSVEFSAYPPHCIVGTQEDNLVNTLAQCIDNNSTICPKNSINGMFAPIFDVWLKEHPVITKFIIVGDVTDICVDSFAKSLKAYFNQINITTRIIIPIDCVETFDLDATNHNADLMNLMAMYGLRSNGIEVVKTIV